MSGLRRAVRHPDRTNDPHVRAHALASDRLLEPLDPRDAGWLDEHLGRCQACRQWEAGITADRQLFASLRELPPPAPRDLGARLAGALDTEVRAALASRRSRGSRLAGAPISEEHRRAVARRASLRAAGSVGHGGGAPARHPLGPSRGRPSFAVAGMAAAALVALLALPILNGPGRPGPQVPAASVMASVAALPAPTPMQVGADPVTYVARTADGSYALRQTRVDAVCPGVERPSCDTLGAESRTIAAIDVTEPTSVVVGRDGDPTVVVGRDAIYVVAIAQDPQGTVSAPAGGSPEQSPVSSPAVTGGAASPPADSPVPSGTPDPAGTPRAAATDDGPMESASSSPGTGPVETAAGSPVPDASATGGPAATASAETDPTAPPASPDATPDATPDPATPDATPEPTTAEQSPEPAPTPAVTIPPATPAPTAARALAIVENVVVMGAPAAYSPDGEWVAFSARPADGGAGPDVYAWRVGSARAARVTSDGASQFGGWHGDRIVVSRTMVKGAPAAAGDDAADVAAASALLDPATGGTRDIAAAAWLPVIAPTRDLVAYWRGSFAWNQAQQAWLPQRGQLVVGSWPDLRDGTGDTGAGVPWSGDIADGADWTVRWDPTGHRLAVWISDGPGKPIGRLSLFRVDTAGTPRSALKEQASLSSFSLDAERLAWATPPQADGEGSRLSVYAWTADGEGQVESDPNAESIFVAP